MYVLIVDYFHKKSVPNTRVRMGKNSIFYKENSHVVIKQLRDIPYTCSGNQHFITADSLITLIYGLTKEHSTL